MRCGLEAQAHTRLNICNKKFHRRGYFSVLFIHWLSWKPLFISHGEKSWTFFSMLTISGFFLLFVSDREYFGGGASECHFCWKILPFYGKIFETSGTQLKLGFYWNHVVINCFSGETQSIRVRLMGEQVMLLINDVNEFLIAFRAYTQLSKLEICFHPSNSHVSPRLWLNK